MATIGSDNEENVKKDQKDFCVMEENQDPADQTSNVLLLQDVLCDSCMDAPSNAVKSCLTCRVSYCEAHLRPHLENAKFQNHRLVDPLHDIDCQTCEVHQLPLRRFCMVDGSCVCLDCEKEKHVGHVIASLEDARAQIETDIQKRHKDINQTASTIENSLGNLQNNNDLIKSSVQEACVLIGEQFLKLQAAVEEARKGVLETLEGEQKQALKQAAGILAHLEQRRAELTKSEAEMNKLSRIKSDVDFLQEYSQWKKGVTDQSAHTAHINRMDHLTSYVAAVTDATQELCDLIVSSYKEKLSMICKSGTRPQMSYSQPSSLLDPETREDFLKYARIFTFDPNSAHHFLRLLDGNRKLTNTSPWQHGYPEHPDRFQHWRQALSSDSLYLGRHYIEAELSGEGAHVGVTYKSIDRKGEQTSSCITGNDFSWCIGRNSRGFSVWHASVETDLEVTDVTRIGFYLDFDRGSVSFYDVAGSMKLLHTYTAGFAEPLYVTVWLSKKDNVVSLVDAKL